MICASSLRRALVAVLGMLSLGGWLVGCGAQAAGVVVDVRAAVEAERFTVGACDAGDGEPAQRSHELRFEAQPLVAEVEVDSERRPAVRSAGAWCWQGRLPASSPRLTVGAQRVPAIDGATTPPLPLAIQVEIRVGGTTEVVAVGRDRDGRWIDLVADLSPWAGRSVQLRVAPQRPASQQQEGSPPPEIAWSGAALFGAGSTSAARPNVVMIVVDTLRADHTTPYGYERDTTPQLERWLAGRGAVFEQAYSQAPWTLPSMVSMMSGRYPGELLGSSDPAAYGIPDGVPALAERFRQLGYRTAAFYANFALRDANGFGRGFDTRYTPPATGRSNLLHADSIQRRVLPWLAAHQQRGEPFFLYVHYLDPHDPYDNPDLVDGRSPFYPDYPGALRGQDVHAVYVGNRALTDPQRDVRQFRALYDSEIAYVDRHLGELVASFDPRVAAETLFLFTADHGEELFDHGGWKHGYTLYDEQIRVPLIVRWDGRVPAGRRLAGTVELLDIVPTLMAAAGGEPDPAWQGIDLLPALSGTDRLPRRPAFAQHLISGPLRAAAVLDRKKLILFNEAEPFAPADLLIERFWRQDLARMERRELYDLAADPGEHSNLAAGQPRLAQVLGRVIDERLDRALPGLRLFVSGVPAGSRLSARATFDQPPTGWHPYFLAAEDRVELAGTVLTLELTGEAMQKGVWITGAGGLRALEAVIDGRPLPPEAVRIGDGAPWRGGAISEAALTADQRPTAPDGPALRLWRRDLANPGVDAALDAEVEESLRALGYIQ